MKNNKLHKTGSKLSEISLKSSGFNVPDNYFDTIEDAVLSEIIVINIESTKNKKAFKTPDNYFKSVEDLVIIKLKSEVIQNENIQKTPENYFTSFEDTILNKLDTNLEITSKRRKIIKIIAPLAIAASLLLTFVLRTNSSTISFDSVTSTEIETWITEGHIDANEYNIASVFEDIELEIGFISLTLEDDEAFDYLYNEDIDDFIFE